jgi:gliding motility-associated-like protein
MLACGAVKCKWLLFLLFLMQGLSSFAQLGADFSAAPNSGCAPVVIKFSDLSIGNPTSWKWDLGNGTISFLRNPSVTYFTPGKYNIKLVISNGAQIDSVTKEQFININASPTVDFSALRTTGCFPLPVQFTDLSVAGSGNIAKWQWDFGDGEGSTISNAEHNYTGAGNFNVSLRVTNNLGCVKSKTKTQYIKLNTGVTSDFSIKTSNSCKAPATVNFLNNSGGVGTFSYEWDFGDGATSDLSGPSHTYTKDGSYSVRLIVKNSTGCTDTLIKQNVVILGNINADFSVPSKVCQDNIVNIANTSKPVPGDILWDFGDGSTSTDSLPIKRYSVTGNFIIKMISNFGACLDSASKTITVLTKPIINFTADKTSDCKAPLTVNFTSNVTGATTYLWDFGDGKTSADKNPAHTYLSAGNFTVKLIATNAAGCSDTLIKPAYIQIQLPQVNILNLPAKGCAPFFFNFSNTVTSTEPVVKYQWDFGDGSGSSRPNPSHTFLLPGNYTISVIVTTASGCTDTLTAVNGVIVGSKPVADFTADYKDVCANIVVSFSDLSKGNVDKWYWSFGDGGISIEQNPKHPYADTGLFNVTLIAMSNGCTDTITFDKYIHISPPIARFITAYDCANPFEKVFTDKSIGADTWQWNFGDGTTSTERNPVHNYNSTGKYQVTLTVTNAGTGCLYTWPELVSVIDEKANFMVSDSVVCKGAPINFTTLNINPANIKSYYWNFGDGIFINTTSSAVQHIYKTAGTYNITFIITDSLGCTDTLIKPMYIRVNGPTAAFKLSTTGSCLNTPITFIDSSFSDGIHIIEQWVWNYGDGTIETLTSSSSQHLYLTPGVFNIKLKVIDSNGCVDSLIQANSLVISKPVAGFNANDTLSCPQKPVIFTNTSMGPGLTYLWNFGDGTTSTDVNPEHKYVTEGVYSVSLSLTDKYGCTDVISKADYIKILSPVADFSMSDSIGTCPPLVVTFTNNSVNAISTSWDFGDGTTSKVNNPSHFFATPGVYDVVLKITSIGGCTTQKSKRVIVKGPEGDFTYSNIVGCNPLQTNFKASAKNASSFVWDFNDGTTVTTTDSIVDHEYTTPGVYLPKLILMDAGGCQVPIIGTDTITVYGVKANFSTNSNMVCDSGTVKFTNNTISNDRITSYSWDFGDGSTSNAQSPEHGYKTTGEYVTRLKVSTQYGCVDTVNVSAPIKVVNSPKVAIGGSNGACVPATLNFAATVLVPDTSDLAWEWNFDNGNTSNIQKPEAQLYSVANNYSVQLKATNSSGCVTTLNKAVQVYPKPNVKIKSDSAICSGRSVNLSATGATTYTWTPAIHLSCTTCANPVAKPDSAIQYFVKGESGEGCTSSDSISITVKYPITLQVSKRDTLCAGKSTILSASGGEKYTWSPSTGLNDASLARPTATPMETTNYRVIATDAIGCYTDTGYIPIKVYPMPKVNAGEDKTINVGKTLDLIPEVSSDVTTVNWSPTSAIFRNNYPGIAVKPNESSEYTVEVSNDGGCMARDKVSVYVLCNNANVFLPNTFSPNGDGSNDIFYPRGSGIFQVKMLRVFNRWGEIVFEKSNLYANDVSSGWNGTYKGTKLTPDVFVYTMDVICDNNTVLTFKGNVSLLR